MPSISEFKKTNHTSAKPLPKKAAGKTDKIKVTGVSPKRRPGREKHMAGNNSSDMSADTSKVKVVDVEHEVKSQAAGTSTEDKLTEKSTSHESHASNGPQAEAKAGVEINFPGSEILRAKFPQTFAVAEKVATDWVHDGDFANLPLPGPAQGAAQQGLRRAKELEKKIANSPLTEKLTMQAFSSLMKAQNFFNQIKEKVQRK